MPQFDFANFVPQLAWLTLFFVILYFGIVRMTLPRVGRVVEGREARIKGDIAGAEAAKSEADRVRESYEQAIAAARGDAHASVVEAQGRATKATEQALKAADAATAERTASATAELAAARATAMTDIERVAAEIAADIVARVAGARPDEAAALAAVRAGA